MKKPRLSRRESVLYSVLMRDEWADRIVAHSDHDEYFDFLCSQSNHADANCPYRRAVAMVEGRE